MENRHWTATQHCHSEFVCRQTAPGKHPPSRLHGLMLHLLHFTLLPKDPQHSYMWVLKDPATKGGIEDSTLWDKIWETVLFCPRIGHRKKKIAPTVTVLAGCYPEGDWQTCEVSKTKCEVLHLGQGNPKPQYRLNEWIESSFAYGWMKNWRWASNSHSHPKKPTGFGMLGCIRGYFSTLSSGVLHPPLGSPA